MYLTIDEKWQINAVFFALDQGGWVVSLTGATPIDPHVILFAEDFDALVEKLKVQLVAKRMEV